MEYRIKPGWVVIPALAAVFALATTAASGPSDAGGFAAENHAAMTKMMKSMDIPPSGNVDRDFATMMIPHHQGAIDMARAELRYGSNERLRRLAQEIVVAQQQEITVMQAVVRDELPAPFPDRTQNPWGAICTRT